MKKLSLKWRIALTTSLLIGVICVSINLLLSYSGSRYMDSIGSYVSECEITVGSDSEVFNPETGKTDNNLTIIIDGMQKDYYFTNWCITFAVTLLGGVLAYFVSGHALKPLRNFASRVENVQTTNLTEMKITEDVIPEFQHFKTSFNCMMDRLDEGFNAQRQFPGNAAHELRTPLTLMQAQIELFAAEHPDILPETADFLKLLEEQTERMAQMTRTLLEMSELHTIPCNDRIQLFPMIEEIFTDLAPLAEKKSVSLTHTGDAFMTGSDTLIYRLLFNLIENAIRYNRDNGAVTVSVTEDDSDLLIKVSDTGFGIPKEYRDSIFQPFFRVDKSRSREYGGVGLGLSLVWNITALHGGEIRAEENPECGTSMTVRFPASDEH